MRAVAQERERYAPKAPGGDAAGGGCLAAPVRWVVLILVVPVRAVWDVLVAALKGLGTALGWLAERLVARPAVWLYRRVLTPLGRGVAWVWRWVVVAPVAWVWRWLVVAPAAWLYANLMTPAGHGLRWLLHHLVVVPAIALHRYVLRPAGRWIAAAADATAAGLVWAWNRLVVAPLSLLWSYVLKPLGGGLLWVLRMLLTAVGWVLRMLLAPFLLLWRYVIAPVWPVAGRITRWFWNATARPVGRAVRSAWRTVRDAFAAARATARRTRAELRATLFGGPRNPAPEAARRPPGPAPANAAAPTVDLVKHGPGHR
ncbi:hypothetical protein [Streptomyces sp. NPDC004134]|uniref:hypothetical protein n=1 Tax=Streptomyces sp. NPDC004134 TaxID=3364691 RepID=UPI00369AD8B4